MTAKNKSRIELAKDKIRERYEEALMDAITWRVGQLISIKSGQAKTEELAKRILIELDDLDKGNLKREYYVGPECGNGRQGTPSTMAGRQLTTIEDLFVFKNINDIK